MKKTKMILPVLMALVLTGCSTSNGEKKSDTPKSEPTSESQPASESESVSSEAVVAGDYKFDIEVAGLTADVEGAANYTIGGVVFTFQSGLMVNTTYKEFGLKPNYTFTMKALGGLKIKKVFFDNYKYYNDCPLYTGEEASGTSAIGVKGTQEGNNLPVTWDGLNNEAYTYKNTYTGNTWTYSVTVTIA